MKPEPLDNRVLILPDAFEEKTQGGIFIPDTAKGHEQKRKGTVVCCGIGNVAEQTGVFTPIKVKEGDRVSFPAYMGEKISGEDIGIAPGEYLLMREWDIDFIIGLKQ